MGVAIFISDRPETLRQEKLSGMKNGITTHVSFSMMIFSGYICSSGVAGSYGSIIPSFLRNLHTVLHSGCYQLTFPPTVQRILSSPHPLQHLSYVDFLMLAILIGVIIILICIL